MNNIKVYILEINFSIAFFKIPYTVKTRKSYIIPRKKSIISLFNSFFEVPISFWKVKRNKKLEKEEDIIKNYQVGAELLNFEKTIEIQRIVQIKSGSVERPPSETELLINPKYRFYLVTDDDIKIREDFPINYYPYAGQNDYLAYSWKLQKKEGKILEKDIINFNNYQLVPSNIVKMLDFSKSNVNILIENAMEDYVIIKGNFILSNKIRVLNVDGINGDIFLF